MMCLGAIGWMACGAFAGHLLSYHGDGLNARHFFGALTGPVAMFVVALEMLEEG